MTRISVGVRASELCDAHLIKERIELLRIPNAVKTGKAVVKDIPKTFTLGKGHVKFFYDKTEYSQPHHAQQATVNKLVASELDDDLDQIPF